MRSILLLFTLVMVIGVLNAQAPLGFSFQTIIRDSEGKVQKNQSVSLRFSILEGSESGSSNYSESHSKTTNEFGVINLTVGTGTPLSGSFSSIVWGSNIHFLKTEIDPTGGSSYSISTTSQLMSVPYAMYAQRADTVLKVPDVSSTNEIQVLSISNDTIYLSDGGFAKLPSGFDGDYTSLSNKPTIPSNTSQLTNDAGFLTSEVDGSITNEIQTISKVDRTVTLSNDGGTFRDSVLTEAQVDAYANNNGYLTSEVDGSITNEIQNLSEVLSRDSLANQRIKNVVDPVDAQDAATKAYIDDLLMSFGISLGSAGIEGLLTSGYSVSDLLSAGVSVSDLLSAGVSVSDLLSAGVSVSDLLSAGSPLTLHTGGVPIDSLYGKTYEGGLIFYLDTLNTYSFEGLVAAPSDQSTGAAWGCYGTYIPGNRSAVGTGAQNTVDIETLCTTAGIAADLCANLSLGGYDDWFLPSKDELNLMYKNLKSNGFGGFASTYY
jgi:hypothetical protein